MGMNNLAELKTIASSRGTTQQVSLILQDNALAAVTKRLKYAVRGGEILDCASWADRYRVMGRSSRYRRWDTNRTPYLREIMDVISDSDPAHREVVIMKCSQVGMSEAMLNEMLRRMHCDPCTILYFAENDKKADFVVSDRLDPALAQTPFAGRPVRSKLNRREMQSGTIIYNGANAPSGLSSTSAKLIIGDECARYPQSIGGEGDFKSLAKGRTRTFGSSYKIVMPSTPTDNIRGEGTFIEAHEAGDKREYRCPCAVCGEFYTWNLERCQRTETAAAMECPECGGLTNDGEQRNVAMAAGKWVPTQEPNIDGTISYHVSGFMAPADWTPWREILDGHVAALTGRASMQTFYNLVLGLPYDEPAARVPKPTGLRQIFQQQDGYRSGIVPDGGAVLTLAIDVQQDYLDCEVKAWGRELENWSIRRFKIRHSIQQTRRCYALIKKIMENDVPTESGDTLRVSLGCIDSGFCATEVYALASMFPQPVVATGGTFVPPGALTPTKGSSRSVSDRLILGTIGRRTNRTARAAKAWQIGTDIAKRELYNSLQNLTRAAREHKQEHIVAHPHFPTDYDEDFFKELVAEQIKTVKSKMTGRLEQVFYCAPNTRNEALDLHVMNRVAAEILGLPGWTENQWAARTAGLAARSGEAETTANKKFQRRAEAMKARHKIRKERSRI